MLSSDREPLVAALLDSEGEVLHAYQDSLGYWTIGVGHCIDKRVGCGITREQSRYILNDDISRVFAEIARLFPWAHDMTPARRQAFAELVFNLGAGKLAGKFTNTIPALAAGRYQRAGDLLKASKWYRDVGPRRGDRIIRALVHG